MIMNKICKHNKKYLKPSNPTFKTYDIYHEAEPRHKRQTWKNNNVRFLTN